MCSQVRHRVNCHLSEQTTEHFLEAHCDFSGQLNYDEQLIGLDSQFTVFVNETAIYPQYKFRLFSFSSSHV